jgi:hypothetical protein
MYICITIAGTGTAARSEAICFLRVYAGLGASAGLEKGGGML